MIFALDTNILVYVEGVNGAAREAASRALIARIPEAVGVIPAQALGELYNVLTRKAAWPSDRARAAVSAWRDTFPLAPTTTSTIIDAVDLAADHRLGIWDSVMIAVAAESGCRLLLSEDLQDGFTWRGVTVVNPFAEPPSSTGVAARRSWRTRISGRKQVAANGQRYDVGGVRLERPFKIRRLGHFGFNLDRIEEGREFYGDLLGFNISDLADFSRAPAGSPRSFRIRLRRAISCATALITTRWCCSRKR